GLLRPVVQRAVLDNYAGAPVAEALACYRQLFSRLSTVQAQLLDVTARRRERAQEADLLRFGIGEIDAIAPALGEDELLRAEIARLAHVDALRVAAASARAALSGAEAPDQDALTLLASARRVLDDARGRDDGLDTLAGRLAEVSYLLSDVAADLAGYAEGLQADPARLEAAQQRLAQLSTLTRKYAGDAAGVIAWAEDARARLAGLEGDDERVDVLGREHAELLSGLAASAADLSTHRAEAARRLAAATTAELTALAMPQARVEVEVRQRDDDAGLLVSGLPGGERRVAFGASGVDDVELMLAGHTGVGLRPLHRGASGGELSRVMLALEVVLAGGDPVPTFLFDEVDAGVGGRAAVEVGRRLAMLARTAQVIVVTHLPQVAAFADHHLVVRKNDDGLVTSTGVRPVDGEERLEELSRMLAGLPDSALGRGHAEELLAVASAAKQQG
ncbi:MAG: repair protein RecN, partial [Frankiaceae bacterium]|nr:repair protein RecN [Frankiaceae bacterium]